jgi:hypothetical protein
MTPHPHHRGCALAPKRRRGSSERRRRVSPTGGTTRGRAAREPAHCRPTSAAHLPARTHRGSPRHCRAMSQHRRGSPPWRRPPSARSTSICSQRAPSDRATSGCTSGAARPPGAEHEPDPARRHLRPAWFSSAFSSEGNALGRRPPRLGDARRDRSAQDPCRTPTRAHGVSPAHVFAATVGAARTQRRLARGRARTGAGRPSRGARRRREAS